MSRTAQFPPLTGGSRATREKITLAAREAFRSEGFEKASTRAIAATAGVNQALIYRYFGSKAGLYDVAVLAPLREFIDEYLDRWDGYEKRPHTATRVASEYLGGLYDLFRGHRELVLALVGGAPAETDGERAQIAGWITQLLDGVQVVVDTEARRRGWSGYRDSRMTIRLSLGLAFSMAVLDRWIFPEGDAHPDRDEVVAHLVSFVLRSMSNPAGFHGIPVATVAPVGGADTDAGVPARD